MERAIELLDQLQKSKLPISGSEKHGAKVYARSYTYMVLNQEFEIESFFLILSWWVVADHAMLLCNEALCEVFVFLQRFARFCKDLQAL